MLYSLIVLKCGRGVFRLYSIYGDINMCVFLEGGKFT